MRARPRARPHTAAASLVLCAECVRKGALLILAGATTVLRTHACLLLTFGSVGPQPIGKKAGTLTKTLSHGALLSWGLFQRPIHQGPRTKASARPNLVLYLVQRGSRDGCRLCLQAYTMRIDTCIDGIGNPAEAVTWRYKVKIFWILYIDLI